MLLYGFSLEHDWLQMNGIICLVQTNTAMDPVIDYIRTCLCYPPFHFRYLKVNKRFANKLCERGTEKETLNRTFSKHLITWSEIFYFATFGSLGKFERFCEQEKRQKKGKRKKKLN